MIQDIAPHKFDNSFKKRKADPSSYVLAFQEKKGLVKIENDQLICPTFKDLHIDLEKGTYLFSIDDNYFYLVNDVKETDEFTYQMLRPLTKMSPAPIGFAYMTGYHLFDWYRNRKYCGRCGKKLSPSDTERALVCSCGVVEYPRIFPAVIIAVTCKDKLLVAHYPHMKKQVLLAGFVEIGETLEECVAREVYEEVGIEVTNIHYYRSQPWGIVSDILAGFYCQANDLDELKVDHNELKSAYWVSRDELDYSESMLDGSLTSDMIYRFKIGENI